MLYFWHYEVGRAAVQPIHYAAQFDHLGIYGAVAGAAAWRVPDRRSQRRYNDGCQPIHAATLNGNLEMVRWLAQQPGVSLTNETDCGWQPTHCAVDAGHLKVVPTVAREAAWRVAHHRRQ
jgi:hypothetical protein